MKKNSLGFGGFDYYICGLKKDYMFLWAPMVDMELGEEEGGIFEIGKKNGPTFFWRDFWGYDKFSIVVVPVDLIGHDHHPEQEHGADNLKGEGGLPRLADAAGLQPGQGGLALARAGADQVAVAADALLGAVQQDRRLDQPRQPQHEQDERPQHHDPRQQQPLRDQPEHREQEQERERRHRDFVWEYPRMAEFWFLVLVFFFFQKQTASRGEGRGEEERCGGGGGKRTRGCRL